ncbi:ABC-F family ATP-binding cassette domain-containing protein [Haliangium ochraceum]|uniref:ABC transporter related protein n=1 Tax=Haliangium ochraceum (strain DSM 14365 / JCM 11303 / SMP-2) TaxID=502025 RepID=D0LL86_HALO1|nr:ABC-F family ATP-binding cassette domain-containing protein [Haliangium ochraceum]ACY18582.1 ABC transporter related protein [Haliangium ochraceum DSM 14365]
MPLVTAQGLSHSFGDRAILDDVSVTIRRGERVGLVGQNGAGKSTLAGILAGTMSPDHGTVSRRSGIEIAYLSQEADFTGFTVARDYILAGLEAWTAAHQRYERASAEIAASAQPAASLLQTQADAAEAIERLGGWDQMHRVDHIAAHLGIASLDSPLANMSGGERRRIALARVLVARPALAILDEPTNHLDVATIEWLESYLTSDYPGALLLITHDRYVLDRVAQRTLELDAGQVYAYDGGWEAYLIAKQERMVHAARVEANRQNLLRRELEWLRRSPKARTTKQQARIDRAVAVRDQDPGVTAEATTKLAFTARRSGKTVAELEGLRVDIAGRCLIDGLDLIIKSGERIGIIGKNGAGKTSLLRVLLGELEPSAGEVTIGSNTRFAYFDQERGELDDERSITDNVAPNREVVEVAGQPVNVKSYLARFLFSDSKQRARVATLSGGERARVAMAKFLLEDANVLLLDEPTNDLDVNTLASLEELLTESEATTLFVTHDRYFLDRVATAVLSFEDLGRVVRYEGSYQALRQQRQAETAAAEAEAAARTEAREAAAKAAGKAADKPADKGARRAKKAGLSFTEKHELERLMPLIEEAEAALAEAEAALADPDLYANRGAEVPALQAACDAARALVEERLARWEELETKRAEGENA